MTQSLSEWDQDLVDDEEDVYRSLYRALERTEGFGLFFVRTKNEQQLVEQIRKDLPREKVEWLRLDGIVEDGNLYKVIAGLPNREQINVLFISGIEKSLEPYIKPGYGGQGDYYKLDTVPRILGHLNLQRERFRDDFPFCLVFLVPLFALKYFIRRAPDFFDWRSGVFEFPMDQETLEQQSSRHIEVGEDEYDKLTHQERMDCVREIQSLIDEENQSDETRYKLWRQQGWVWYSDGNLNAMLAAFDQAIALNLSYSSDFCIRGLILGMLERHEEAIASYDKALEIKPDAHQAWFYRGFELRSLGRYEEAIASFDQALAIKPDDHQAWFNRGIALVSLGRYEEAIASYDKALAIKLDDYQAWFNRGILLTSLGRYEEANASFDQALEIKPDNHKVWHYRGRSLENLGRCEEAIVSFDKALAIKPDDHQAWFYRGLSLDELGRYEEAIVSFDKALEIKPDNHHAWCSRGITLGFLGRYEEAIASFDQTLKLKPDDHQAWDIRGYVLAKAGRYSEAIESYNKALEIAPTHANAVYNKAVSYALQADVEPAIELLQQAIDLDPKYREMAKTDRDFDQIRADQQFRQVTETIDT
jgi:tetratricopeptide (TPR) repeat protein